ncbi:AAA family ATPase [Gryllotalpicola protaetiae]|uniref:Regulator n=1 Tax=Gryllotalpicola protaetiae TaxID=2419771 RepID=A0A387BTC1_9MICO|nr:regulator [Gryllotalpicola protaetiae]AYG04310.1 regulator [Gryllotalpicola protaetiae]
MAQLALSLDRRTEDALLPGALAAGHAVVARVQTAGELSTALAAHEIDIAVVSATRSRLTPELRAAAAATGTRLVVLAGTADEREVAARAGAPEVFAEPAGWAELERLLSAQTVPAAGEAQAATAEASVIAVWGPAGAPGRTSLAISIAAELALVGSTVALIDADSYGGAVAPWLGLLDETPGFAAACRLAGNDALTRAEFDRVAQYVPVPRGSLAVLTGIARPSRWPELGSERVARVIDAVAGWVDHVVIDVGFNLEADEEIASDLFAPRRNAATLTTLEHATQLVSVGLADPLGLSRLLRGRADAEAAAPRARHSLVVNRVRAGVLGANPGGQVTAALQRFGGVSPAALVPDDPQAFDVAMLAACPLAAAAPRSAAREAIRRLVHSTLLGLAEPAPARRRRSARPRRAHPAAQAAARSLDLSRVDPQ